MISSRYEYSCDKCGGRVEKLTPCHTEKDKDGNTKDYAGLHGWRCEQCGLGVKVKRTLK